MCLAQGHNTVTAVVGVQWLSDRVLEDQMVTSPRHTRDKCAVSFSHSISSANYWFNPGHGLKSLPPSPKRAERKGRRRPFREAGSGHKQWNTVSCVDTFSIISKFSAQNLKI